MVRYNLSAKVFFLGGGGTLSICISIELRFGSWTFFRLQVKKGQIETMDKVKKKRVLQIITHRRHNPSDHQKVDVQCLCLGSLVVKL
jgi:hypothetical protein